MIYLGRVKLKILIVLVMCFSIAGNTIYAAEVSKQGKVLTDTNEMSEINLIEKKYEHFLEGNNSDFPLTSKNVLLNRAFEESNASELTDMRTIYSKTFELRTGQFSTVSSLTPLHYVGDNGQLLDIEPISTEINSERGLLLQKHNSKLDRNSDSKEELSALTIPFEITISNNYEKGLYSTKKGDFILDSDNSTRNLTDKNVLPYEKTWLDIEPIIDFNDVGLEQRLTPASPKKQLSFSFRIANNMNELANAKTLVKDANGQLLPVAQQIDAINDERILKISIMSDSPIFPLTIETFTNNSNVLRTATFFWEYYNDPPLGDVTGFIYTGDPIIGYTDSMPHRIARSSGLVSFDLDGIPPFSTIESSSLLYDSSKINMSKLTRPSMILEDWKLPTLYLEHLATGTNSLNNMIQQWVNGADNFGMAFDVADNSRNSAYNLSSLVLFVQYTPPNTPYLTIGNTDYNSITLNWIYRDHDNVELYEVYQDKKKIAESISTEFVVGKLSPNVTTEFYIIPVLKNASSGKKYGEVSNLSLIRLDSKQREYTYNKNNQLENIIIGKQNIEKNFENNKLVSLNYSGQLKVTYSYDANGNLVKIH